MQATTLSTRENPAQLKVIGLGFGRTGTLSLCTALEKLGFGPCHHPIILGVDCNFNKLTKALRGDASPEALDGIYRGYGAAMDMTTATLAEPLYKAYPGAKFILTTRDGAKWAQSMRRTSIKTFIEGDERESRIVSGTASEEDRILSEKMKEFGIADWVNEYLGVQVLMSLTLQRAVRLNYPIEGYHQGRLIPDPEGEFDRHNRFIIDLIPPEKLLIFNVSEGWGPLVNFLGVLEPDEPFPNINDLTGYNKNENAWQENFMQA